jgi:hypothetical protein
VQPRCGGKKRALAASLAVTAVAALAFGIGGTAQSESSAWPDGRVAALWPTFSMVPRAESPWNGAFGRCVESSRVRFDYRCEYADAAGRVGYVCLAAGDSSRDLSRSSVDAVVAPGDRTYEAASPAQVCFASLAYALSLS